MASPMDPQYESSLSEDGKTFTLTFIAPKQLLLHPEYDAMVNDQVLRFAHQQAIIPIGAVFHTEEDYNPAGPPQVPLKEGEDMVTRRLRAMGIGPAGPKGSGIPLGEMGMMGPRIDLMKVTAEVAVGSSLDLTLEEPTQPSTSANSLEDLLSQEIPDDLSELDGL